MPSDNRPLPEPVVIHDISCVAVLSSSFTTASCDYCTGFTLYSYWSFSYTWQVLYLCYWEKNHLPFQPVLSRTVCVVSGKIKDGVLSVGTGLPWARTRGSAHVSGECPLWAWIVSNFQTTGRLRGNIPPTPAGFPSQGPVMRMWMLVLSRCLTIASTSTPSLIVSL